MVVATPWRRGCDEGSAAALGPSIARGVAVAGPARGGAPRGSASVLGGDCAGSGKRGGRGPCRSVTSGGGTLVPGGRRDAAIDACAVVKAVIGAVFVAGGTGGDRAVAGAGPRSARDCPPAGAGRIDDLPRAAAQRCHARWRPGVSGQHRTVACRAGGAPSEAGKACSQRGAADLRAGPASRRGRYPGRGRGRRAGRALEGPPAWASAGSVLGQGVEPAADRPAAAARLPG